MYVYEQRTGNLFSAVDVELLKCPPIGKGYSGFGPGKDNPAMQNVPDVGPIPQGSYTIGQAFNSPDHGPLAMPLTPDPLNEMFDRSGFLMHGDSLEHPGEASKGCIIMPREIREQVSAGTDRLLVVIA